MSTKLFAKKSPIVPLRGVHLDLKGNPPTNRRLLQLLDVFAALKLNVVLAEWEDTFPWRRYPELQSPTAYPPEVIGRFFARADKLGIEIIPLVQCLGHSENVLSKKRFRALRETGDNVAEFCPSSPGSAELVIDLVNDVLALSGGRITRFHLGGDEAWHMGSCPKCRCAIAAQGRGELYLKHVGPVLDHLESYDVRPILWHDMMRNWSSSALRRLGKQADLMAWSYIPDPAPPTYHHLNEKHLANFRRNGVPLWGGSAYKGAEDAFADVPDIRQRADNNLGWARLARKYHMEGVVATAWCRFNTFLAPAETIASSLDALALAASALWDGKLPKDLKKASRACLRRIRGGAEARIFARCHKASSDLAGWRGSMDWFVSEAERAAHLVGEPERINPGVIREQLGRIRKLVRKGRKLGEVFVRAHRGLIPDRWLKLYVMSRLLPLERRARRLLTRAHPASGR